MPVAINEGAERESMERGNLADELLKNEAFIEALSDVEKVYVGAWRNSRMDDIDLRERAHMCVCLLADLKGVLVGRVRAGKHSQEKLAEHSLGL